MKIIGISIADKNTASSRIRFFRFLEYLPSDFNYEIYSGNLNCDILYVQKNARSNIIEVAKKAKELNIPIVYDIDDDFGIWPDMDEIEMLNLSSIVITDTDMRASYLKNYTKTPIKIVPDSLDYVSDYESKVIISETLKNIVTFGNNTSLNYTSEFYNNVPENYIKNYIGAFPNILCGNFIPWQLSSFLQSLKCFDVGILVHPDDNKGNMKSNNRLLVCMSIGLPVIVSNTSAYSNTLKNIDCEFLIVKDVKDIRTIFKTIEPQKIRQEISIKFQNYAWNNFAPRKSSNILAEIFIGLKK